MTSKKGYCPLPTESLDFFGGVLKFPVDKDKSFWRLN